MSDTQNKLDEIKEFRKLYLTNNIHRLADFLKSFGITWVSYRLHAGYDDGDGDTTSTWTTLSSLPYDFDEWIDGVEYSEDSDHCVDAFGARIRKDSDIFDVLTEEDKNSAVFQEHSVRSKLEDIAHMLFKEIEELRSVAFHSWDETRMFLLKMDNPTNPVELSDKRNKLDYITEF